MTDINTVLIVDDQPLFRVGLKSAIENKNGYRVVGEVCDGGEALRICEIVKPHVALVDLYLSGKNGMELIRGMRNISPKTRILIVSPNSRTDHVVEVFEAGAMGYVLKDCGSDTFLLGMDTVLRGEYFLDGFVSGETIERVGALLGKEARISNAAYGSLTPREQEVMALLAEGLPRKTISERLFISPKTIENHISSIMKKLSIRSTFELMRYAVRVGAIDVDRWKG